MYEEPVNNISPSSKVKNLDTYSIYSSIECIMSELLFYDIFLPFTFNSKLIFFSFLSTYWIGIKSPTIAELSKAVAISHG